MKEDKWIEQLRDKLDGYETPAPEGLWADIESALAQQQPKPRKSRIVALRRWAVAAVVTALMLSGGYILWNHEEASQPEILSEAPCSETASEVPPSLTAMTSLPPVQPSIVAEAMADEAAKSIEPTELTETAGSTEITEPTEIAEPTEITEADNTNKTTEMVESNKRHETTDAYLPYRSRDSHSPHEFRSSHAVPTLGLYAMNGFGNPNSSNGVLMAPGMVEQFEKTYENSNVAAARITEPIYLTGYEERQHHRRPISYGLTLSYPLTKRLSLTTGVVYSKLVSEFTQIMNSQQIQQEQTLHYVGIPIGLNFRLWSLKGFSAYISGGVKADWNVATRMVTEGTTQELGKDRLQWSFNGSAGAQYDILPQLGLYVEPGLSYYPDNGSRLQNYFKDKPWSLSLQFGLRVNLNR